MRVPADSLLKGSRTHSGWKCSIHFGKCQSSPLAKVYLKEWLTHKWKCHNQAISLCFSSPMCFLSTAWMTVLRKWDFPFSSTFGKRHDCQAPCHSSLSRILRAVLVCVLTGTHLLSRESTLCHVVQCVEHNYQRRKAWWCTTAFCTGSVPSSVLKWGTN